MLVVSDTSPILNLAIIGQLDLLRTQFSEVLIPPAVLAELKPETESPGADVIRRALQAQWIRTTSVRDDRLIQALRLELDEGEAEAIALALELKADYVLIDEHEGREIAKAMLLTPIGILGVLLRAKRDGALDAVEPVLRALRQEAGFYIAEDLFTVVLAEAGER
ncbi:MAG: DUF3368 domain-containing protein [Chloroflexi bacterium]|nr:DUF3368 domain-containing protein [Chloroflexota bacterium]